MSHWLYLICMCATLAVHAVLKSLILFLTILIGNIYVSDVFQCLVSTVYNLVFIQALSYMSCRFADEERMAWRSRSSEVCVHVFTCLCVCVCVCVHSSEQFAQTFNFGLKESKFMCINTHTHTHTLSHKSRLVSHFVP